MTTGATALVGRLRRVHGLKGEFVVALQTDAPDAIFAPGARLFVGSADGELAPDPATGTIRQLVVRSARDFKDGLLVMFEGITDRTEAERWGPRTLHVPFDELEPPAAGELWAHELPGFRALDPRGAVIGEIRSYYALPQGLVLEVLTAHGPRDVPFNDAFVRDVDRVARTMILDVPAGLLE